MSRPPAALLLCRCGSVFYATEILLAYVAADGRKIRLLAVHADDRPVARGTEATHVSWPWDFVPGYILNECLFVGSPVDADGAAGRDAVWALYEAGAQPAPARLSLARSASISSSMSATSAASSGAAS
jgi:hypothetical protein